MCDSVPPQRVCACEVNGSLPEIVEWEENEGEEEEVTVGEGDRHLVCMPTLVYLKPRVVRAPLPLRPVEAADRSGLLDGLVAARRPMAPTCSRENLASVLGRILDHFLEEPSWRVLGASYLAHDGGIPVGAALVAQSQWGPWLKLVFVQPSHRRFGVATALVSIAGLHLLARGHTRLFSDYDLEDKGAKAWQAAYGFKDTYPGPRFDEIPLYET